MSTEPNVDSGEEAFTPSAIPPPPPAPESTSYAFGPAAKAKQPTPKRAMEARAAAEFEKNAEEFDGYLQELDFDTGAGWKIVLSRELPREDPETGIAIEGWCGEYIGKRVSRAEIAVEHGGGTYRALIYGPKPLPGGGTKVGLVTSLPVKISGAPIPPLRKHRGGSRVAVGAGNDTAGVVDRMAASSKEQLEMVMSALKGGGNSELVALLTKTLDPKASAETLAEERRLRDEERRADRAAREEERKDKEAAEERKEKARAAERAAELQRLSDERKHELSLMQARLDNEKAVAASNAAATIEQAKSAAAAAIAQAEANARLQIAALQAQTESQKQAFALQIESVKAQSESERRFLSEMSTNQQALQNNHTLAMQKVSDAALVQQRDFAAQQQTMLEKRLEMMEKSKGGTKELLEHIELIDRIRGDNDNENDEPMPLRVVEKLFEGVGKVAPGLFAAAGVGVGAAAAAKRQAQATAQANAQVEPGSVAVLENGQRKQLKRRRPPEANKAQVQDAQIVETATAGDAPRAPTPNDLIDYILPSGPPDAAFEPQTVELLVKNLDFAVQKNASPEDIAALVKRFPKAVVDYLKSLPVDLLISELENTPAMKGWAINSTAGQTKIRAVHALMQS